jgi:hypothetical protein
VRVGANTPSLRNSTSPAAAANRGRRLGRLVAALRPASRPLCVTTQRIAVHRHAGQLGQAISRHIERPTGRGQAGQPHRPKAKETLQPQTPVERISRVAAAGTAKRLPAQPHRTGRSHGGLVYRTLGLTTATAGTVAAVRPFFSAAAACSCSVASKARRVNSRPRRTAAKDYTVRFENRRNQLAKPITQDNEAVRWCWKYVWTAAWRSASRSTT